jgi:hypothetical protein
VFKTKQCREKANKLIKYQVAREVENEEFVALVTTVKLESFIVVKTRIEPHCWLRTNKPLS